MNKLILITGGARSGKSSFAEQLALRMNDFIKRGRDIAYIATGVPVDEEFKDRIIHHQKNRDRVFKVYEESINIDETVNNISDDHNVFLLDCITTWLGNLFCKDLEDIESFADKIIDNLIGKFCETQRYNLFNTNKGDNNIFKKINKDSKILIIVSNELGLGLVPEDKMSRSYRDIHGRINQKIALQSSAFYFTLSGIPQRVK
jgi:adenosylcobinamide kinase/adenosylcobinamide-phosphate guanylyltransferase